MNSINWGVLSSAKIAKEHVIPAIKKSKNSNLYAIASRKKSKALNFSKKFKSISLGYLIFSIIVNLYHLNLIFYICLF